MNISPTPYHLPKKATQSPSALDWLMDKLALLCVAGVLLAAFCGFYQWAGHPWYTGGYAAAGASLCTLFVYFTCEEMRV